MAKSQVPWKKWAIIFACVATWGSGASGFWLGFLHPLFEKAIWSLVVAVAIFFAVAAGTFFGLRRYFSRLESQHASKEEEAEQAAQRKTARSNLEASAHAPAAAFLRELFGDLKFCRNPRHPEPCCLTVEMTVICCYCEGLERIRALTNTLRGHIVHDHNPRNPKTVEGHRDLEAKSLYDAGLALLASDGLLAVARRHPRSRELASKGEALARTELRGIFDSLNVSLTGADAETKAGSAMEAARRAADAALRAIGEVQTMAQQAKDTVLETGDALSKLLQDPTAGCEVLYS